ncbi:L,D-transpeptidase [Actinomadura madurae]|uniref:L,D-transpeptidase n=1 Tax=Actinomadura madurae TaxID=1993 RepID=UPI0020D21AF3|nr:L,D-transpeptidase [Actinomadura madurae]MCP9952466.1 L,D-transpeptidase [Actinomadura madurae]MCP9969223.1 L,D-transpeptidase [Actinomadura madurae]MCQ0006786.1 L,D-transpeptidase [Actinomadura madurae]
MSDEPPRAARTAAPALLVTALLVTGCGGGDHPGPGGGASPAGASDKLPQATTYTTLNDLPRDSAPSGTTDGTVVHPDATVPVSAKPGAPAVAELPSTQLKGPTWVPVLESRPGWRRVLLPSRPNGVTGWIPDSGLKAARSSGAIKVDLSDRRLTLSRGGRKAGAWSVAVGAPKTPTPTGRTFLLASLAPEKPTYSPLILPVGAHSATLDTFGGGPGTVAFHGWPSKSVFGQAVTHGCVRVPADALKQLAKVPLGTPVHITE